MNMKKYKLIGGLVALIAGFVLLGYGVYGTYRMAEARQDIDSKMGFIPEHHMKDIVSGKLNARVDEYRLPVALCYVGAVVLIIGGSILIYYGRK